MNPMALLAIPAIAGAVKDTSGGILSLLREFGLDTWRRKRVSNMLSMGMEQAGGEDMDQALEMLLQEKIGGSAKKMGRVKSGLFQEGEGWAGANDAMFMDGIHNTYSRQLGQMARREGPSLAETAAMLGVEI